MGRLCRAVLTAARHTAAADTASIRPVSALQGGLTARGMIRTGARRDRVSGVFERFLARLSRW
jgi:hypothetical protein